MLVSLHHHPHSGKNPPREANTASRPMNWSRGISAKGLPPAIALRNNRALIGAPGIGNGLAIQRLNLALRSAITMPQRRVPNDPRRVVVAAAQVGDEVE
jgi:hypothetical protein